jgi:CDP-2,3-bis-(O-geranylgeranyl)-sn-glycerol synthase
MHPVLFAIWFFLPAGIANVSPVFTSRIGFLRFLYKPLDLGKKFNGRRMLGDNKTWLGLLGGVLMGFVVIILQKYGFIHSEWIRSISEPVNYNQANILYLGPLLGLGAIFGDSVESFFKRQIGINPGKTWFPFDQLDYILGGLLFSLIIVQLNLHYYLVIIVVWLLVHLVFTYAGYLVGLREDPI